MAYAKSESMQPTPLIKAAVQLDLLEVGKEYTASVALRAGKIRSRQFVVLGCYPDYYSIRDLTNGRVETLRKSDIHCGIIKIEGLNIKEKVLEVIEDLKVKEAERVKVSKELIEAAIIDGYNWIVSHPGKDWFIADKCSEFDGYQKNKIYKGVWDRFVFEGHENRIQQIVGAGGTKGFKLMLKAESVKAEEPKPEQVKTTYKPEEMSATLESTKEILRVDGLKEVTDQMFYSVSSTFNLLKLTGKNVVLDIVFREV